MIGGFVESGAYRYAGPPKTPLALAERQGWGGAQRGRCARRIRPANGTVNG